MISVHPSIDRNALCFTQRYFQNDCIDLPVYHSVIYHWKGYETVYDEANLYGLDRLNRPRRPTALAVPLF